MSDALKCTSCRSPIDVPADHAGDTIRCGICWTEVAVPKVTVLTPVAPSGAIPTAKVLPATAGSGATKLSGIQVAALLPTGSRPAAGMARLEALIHKAGAHLRPSAVVKLPPVATRLPAVGSSSEIVVAELLPETPSVAPTAVPVHAPVLRPAPVGKLKGDPDDSPKPRYRTRGHRDDDDDLPQRRSTRGGALVFALTGAAVLILVLGFCGYWLIREFVDSSSDDTSENQPVVQANNAAPQPNVNANPLPPFRVPDPVPEPNNPPVIPNNPPAFVPPQFNPPRPQRPQAEVVWTPVAGDGFAAEMPGAAREDSHWLHVHGTGAAARAGFVKADGKKYTVRVAGHTFDVSFVDLPAAFEPNLRHVLTPFRDKQERIQTCRFVGRDGLEFVEDFIGTTHRRLVQVGRRVYVFHAQTGGGREAQANESLRKKFFDSVKLTGEGGAGPAGEPEGPAGRPNDIAPGQAVAAAHRVPPFWAAVTLPQRNEVLFFGTRVGNTGRVGGELRRFTYPGFLPKGTYYLPYPVTFAVADEKAGKLAVTTVTRTDAMLRDNERNVAHGDVQVYDLKAIYDGSVAERDELKPAATVPFASRLAGLELADGKAVVLSLTSQSLNKARPWKPKLTQIDLATGRTVQDMELPDTMCRIKASPDGKRIYAAEAPLSPVGSPIFMLPRNGYILVVDAKGWKREKTFPVPGTACDLAVTPDGVVLASVTLNRDFKLYAFGEAGNPIDLNPAAGKPVCLGYVALTADGRKLVTAASVAAGATGIAVQDVSNLDGPGGLKSVCEARMVKLPNAAADAQAPIGGHFHLTPDGKFALFQMGVVLELAKLGGN